MLVSVGFPSMLETQKEFGLAMSAEPSRDSKGVRSRDGHGALLETQNDPMLMAGALLETQNDPMLMAGALRELGWSTSSLFHQTVVDPSS